MYTYQKIQDDLFYVGGSDRRLNLFENAFPIPRGMSYNSYLLLDEKNVLFDTVDKAVGTVFFENLYALLKGKTLDYVVITHMEPDHAATLQDLIEKFPEVKIICSMQGANLIKQFFTFCADDYIEIKKEGETLTTGNHELTFVMAPMVHWPEVMLAYDKKGGILFSADAFGTFGALSGNLFADEMDFPREWLEDARRYYANIVGKYGMQVQALLKKAAGLEIKLLCPLHGPVWRKDISWFVDKYQKWSTYTPEDETVMIAYASVYGDTENAATILANNLALLGVHNIKMYDVSVTHPSEIVSESFRASHLVFAATTYNMGLFITMETALLDIKAHNLQNRTIALIENGSWAPMAGKHMKDILGSLKNCTILEGLVTIKSSVKEEQRESLGALAEAIVATMKK